MNKTNEPLDVDYFSKKLKSIVRDLSSYRADELSRELSKLSVTACQTDTITIKAAEYAKLKKDAERYQWLRDNKHLDIFWSVAGNKDRCKNIDDDIDQAIKESK